MFRRAFRRLGPYRFVWAPSIDFSNSRIAAALVTFLGR